MTLEEQVEQNERQIHIQLVHSLLVVARPQGEITPRHQPQVQRRKDQRMYVFGRHALGVVRSHLHHLHHQLHHTWKLMYLQFQQYLIIKKMVDIPWMKVPKQDGKSLICPMEITRWREDGLGLRNIQMMIDNSELRVALFPNQYALHLKDWITIITETSYTICLLFLLVFFGRVSTVLLY